MAHREFTLSHIPVYCQSPTAGPPEHKALLIGINYASTAGDNEQLETYRELKGPVNDAKEMKRALIGAVSARSLFRPWDLTPSSPRAVRLQGRGHMLDDGRGSAQGHGAVAFRGQHRALSILPLTGKLDAHPKMGTDARIAQSRARRISRRCVRLLL